MDAQKLSDFLENQFNSDIRAFVVDECESTNTLAAEMSEKKEMPFAVAARRQTRGRGRMSRSWFSEEGASICMSIAADMLGKPAQLLESATVRCGVAVCAALNEMCAEKAMLKWPNDIYTPDGAKIAGMLAELLPNKNGYKIIFGIGINYNLSKTTPPRGLSVAPADIFPRLSPDAAERGIEYVAAAAADAMARELAADSTSSLARFGEFDYLYNSPVKAACGARKITGTAVGINASGNLLISAENGTTTALNSGEAFSVRQNAEPLG